MSEMLVEQIGGNVSWSVEIKKPMIQLSGEYEWHKTVGEDRLRNLEKIHAEPMPEWALPFDLKKALAGHPIRTRCGDDMKEFTARKDSFYPFQCKTDRAHAFIEFQYNEYGWAMFGSGNMNQLFLVKATCDFCGKYMEASNSGARNFCSFYCSQAGEHDRKLP